MSSNIKPCRPAEEAPQPRSGRRSVRMERLTRNIVLASALLLAVVGARGYVTGGGDFLQTVKNAVESEWDQNVGRLTYVSGSLADSIQVFGQKRQVLIAPVAGTAEAADNYLVYTGTGTVYAAAEGEVTQIAHDDAGRSIVRLSHEDGLNTVYYGLDTCAVQEGEPVEADTVLGAFASSLAFEAQKYGRRVDVADSLRERTARE